MSYAAAFAPRPLGVSPHRSDDSQVWQVAAPCAGVVAQQHIARVEVSPQVLDLELHRLLHGAQVHRNVGGIGDQPPIGSEEGAGEVQPLLDVGGDGRALQDAAHLLSNAHEAV